MASRGKHNFPSALKQAWRLRNLDFLTQYGRAIWIRRPTSQDAGELRPSVVELLGESGFLSYELFRPLLPSPDTDYVGIENSPKTVGKVLQQPHEFQVRYADIGRYLQYERRPISVILWDDMACAGTLSWWGKAGHGARLEAALRTHSQAYGEVALIFNMSLRNRKDTREVQQLNLEVMRRELARIFSVDPALIIKDPSIAATRSPSGPYESLEFYRSELTPMVTFRAVYAAQGHHRLQGMTP